MIVGFQYTAMKITGAFHLGIGTLCFIISMVGYSIKLRSHHSQGLIIGTSTATFIISLWVIMVGIFGIFAGLKSNTELEIQKRKITYMVLAILSACLFSTGGICAFSIHAILANLLTGHNNFFPLFCVGSFAMFLEFVLAIVSSSICCCCSQTTNRGVVIQQNKATEFVNPSIDRNFAQVTYYSPNVAAPYMPPQ